MTMLARLTEVMRRARMRGDWDDERVVLEVLAKMRSFDAEVVDIDIGTDDAREVWRHMIDTIRARATEPADAERE
jgi:hypothetical protein